ncbi:hypothetical protein ACQKE0_04320 [Shewanella colwelliana]|uniref:hypothetical protein n=1 Tax=Shewanella colwelliana TaxID=23 RepID=UPI003D081B44
MERKLAVSEWKKSFALFLKAMEVNEEFSLKTAEDLELIPSRINKSDADKLNKIANIVDNDTWAYFLRYCRDERYEQTRTRITVRKKTGDDLRDLAQSTNMESIDDLITVLMKKVTKKELRAVSAKRRK